MPRVWLAPPRLMLPALLKLGAVRLSVLPALAVTVPRLVLTKLVGLRLSVAVELTASVPLLVTVVGLTVKVWPATLARMLPLLISALVL